MSTFDGILLGLATAATAQNLLYCFLGCLLGTLIGVLPGLGPTATIAMLLPVTFTLEPTTALIMLGGIYFGAQYGGSTTAILLKLPGEASSIVTALDGHAMARNGRAGAALSIAAIGSFVAGTLATVFIVLFSPPLAWLAMRFGPADYFSLMVLGLLASIALSHGSMLKALIMVLTGLLLGTVGIDMFSGVYRLTFGVHQLAQGIDMVPVAMGIFGLGEIMYNLHSRVEAEKIGGVSWRKLLPSRAEFRASALPILRGTALGSVLGVLPGSGAVLSSFISYATEKKLARDPARFGKGAIEGVAGPESANNAGAQTSMIPMLTLGIPSNTIMALLAGTMIIHGIQPGPAVMTHQPALFWGVIASMWIANLMLVVLNLPLVGIFVRLLTIPYSYLIPIILLFCCIGAYSMSNSPFDIYVMVIFGIFGYGLRRLGCEPAPLILALVIGPMLEEYFRRTMSIYRGDATAFLASGFSATMLALAAIILVMMIVPSLKKRREEAFRE